MLALLEAERGVDLVTLADALHQAGELELVGGAPMLAQLADPMMGAIPAHLDSYAQIVLREAGKREAIQAMLQAAERAYEPGHDPAAIAAEVAERLGRIADRTDADEGRRLTRPGPPQPIGAVLEAIVDGLDQPETDFVPSPVQDLNDRLGGGMLRAEFCILGGRPGMAKTALAIQWAVHAAQYGHRTLVVSREMKNAALGRRVLAQQAQVSATALRRRDLDEAERTRIVRNLPRLAALPIWFDDQAVTLAQIRRRVREGRYRFVIVDYLQLVRSPADSANRRLEVTAISAGLKDMAKRLDCSILGLSALKRLQVEKGKRLEPTLDDLKESGDIEADADVVVLLHQPDKDSPDRKLIFAKLREGESGGAATLVYTPMYVRFQDLPSDAPGWVTGKEPI